MTDLHRLPDNAALPCVDDLVASLRPQTPLSCFNAAVVREAGAAFVAGFPGCVMYAVKCNPEPAVLQALWDGGVQHFDCASLPEVALVSNLLPSAKIHFMHPVKGREAIARAYEEYGVRDFVFDGVGEFDKIMQETGHAADLGLIVRLALPAGPAKCDLSGKFGAEPDEAAALLRAARPHTGRLGVSFHVGSQCMDPLAWRSAIKLAGQIIQASGVAVDIIDVGGGFPVAYADQDPQPLAAFFAEIEAGIDALDLPDVVLWAEPGRALAAAGTSIVVQVQMRRGGALYINDGVFGGLADAGSNAMVFPTRLLRASDAPEQEWIFFGPTCDSADIMHGPFTLPADVAEGDWIEIGQAGAYNGCLRSSFNGFGTSLAVEVRA